MSGPCLETRGLVKRFGAVAVTAGVDFALYPGERRALIGPNGAGKTTFVNLLTGRLRPDGGSIHIGGVDVTAMGEARRIRLGLGRTFQITALFPALTVRENVFLAVAEASGIGARMIRPIWAHPRQHETVEALLQRVGLDGQADTMVQVLPYGQQRLLELALALALEPKILILDEPAAGVSPADSARVLALIEELPADIAILLIDHDMDLIFRFARRITVLAQGAVLAEGTPAEIAADPRVRAAYLGGGRHGRHPAA